MALDGLRPRADRGSPAPSPGHCAAPARSGRMRRVTDPQNDPVLLAVEEGVATLTLNRPEAGNQFEETMAAALEQTATAIADRDDVRVIVLRGAGKAFCFGGDIGFFAAAEDPAATLDGMSAHLHAAMRALSAAGAPLVAVVQGPAMGVGLSFVALADVVIAGEAATFMAGYSNVGLSPDGGMTWTLPRKVGIAQATDLMLRNAQLSAREALELGIVTEVVADDELQDVATKRIGRLAQGPTATYAAIRALLQQSLGATFSEQLDAERASLVDRAGSPEGREGTAAFAERRRPDFAAARTGAAS